ncbi:DUF2357 domain-containing protein [Comamonas sp. MYb69]|uniref:DUF2357 domain-containing protein n=1 Tax=Comamonas sp. MYb69 TaxID=1848650 RepID=UPI0030AE44F0
MNEDNDYLLDAGTKPGTRIYVDDVELIKDLSGLHKWRPSFYAGQVALEVVAPGERACYFLDVSPTSSKSGQAAYEEMISDIRAFDQSLLNGTSSASMEFGHSGRTGRYELDILLSRLRVHGPKFLNTVESIANSPHRALAAEARRLPLSRVRRLHPSSLQDRRLASLALGYAQAIDAVDSLQVNSQTSAPTFDTPANRALLSLLRRFRAAVTAMQDCVRDLKLGSPREEQILRIERRLEDLHKLEIRSHTLLIGTLFSEVSSSETTSAGLTQIAALPTYSRAYRIGCRALDTGIQGDNSADKLHIPPSWGIYETWCFIQVVQAVREITQKQAIEANAITVAAERCISFSLDNGSSLEVLFQATFPSLKPSSKRLGWSLSKERRPDLILVYHCKGERQTFVLDAKWRSGRSNVLDAMESAHIYHDALRMDNRAPTFSLLLLPGASEVPEFEAIEFIQTHAIGAVYNFRVDGKGSSSLAADLRGWLIQADADANKNSD